MTKEQLIEAIKKQDWNVIDEGQYLELFFYSPAGEEFFITLKGYTTQEIIESLKNYEFDAEAHAASWFGQNAGEPSSLQELLNDAEVIKEKIEELKRKVNNFIEPNTVPVSNKAGECPFCGSLALDYGALEVGGEDIYYPWTCTHCGASGREMYELSFAGHYQCVSPNGEYLEEIENN